MLSTTLSPKNATDYNSKTCDIAAEKRVGCFATHRSSYDSAVLPEKQINIGALNSTLTVGYSYMIKTLTEEDVDNAGVYMDIFVH